MVVGDLDFFQVRGGGAVFGFTLFGDAVLLSVAIWFFTVMSTTDPTARSLSGAVLGILGLALMIMKLKNK